MDERLRIIAKDSNKRFPSIKESREIAEKNLRELWSGSLWRATKQPSIIAGLLTTLSNSGETIRSNDAEPPTAGPIV